MSPIDIAALIPLAATLIMAITSIMIVFIAVRGTDAVDRPQVLKGAAEVISATLGKNGHNSSRPDAKVHEAPNHAFCCSPGTLRPGQG